MSRVKRKQWHKPNADLLVNGNVGQVDASVLSRPRYPSSDGWWIGFEDDSDGHSKAKHANV
jgi:hypothetical protein